MDPNGNLNYSERRALKPGDRVVYQTEGTAHRGEQRGRVSRVGESGVVWIGTTGSRYALACDYLRRADWAPEKSSGAAAREEFLRDIAPTREMVAKWPAWKRNALGQVPKAPDFPPVATPEPARRAKAPKTGKDTPKASNAPEGQETRSSGVYGPTLVADPETGLMMAPAVAIEALRARVEALTAERDQARQKLKTMMMAAVALIETAKEVCGE